MIVVSFNNYLLKKIVIFEKRNMEAEPLELEDGEVIDNEVKKYCIILYLI